MNIRALFSPKAEPDPVNIQQTIERGRQAEALLNNVTLNLVFEETLRDCTLAWLASGAMQYDERTELYLRAQAIQALRAKLNSWITDALVEARNLEIRERRKKEI